MAIRIAICDDDPAQREYLTLLLNKWGGERKLSAEAYPSAEAFLFAYEEDKAFDLLLLDIQMKAMDGIELARVIRKDNDSLQIVFITGYPDFMAEGFEVSALHYLVKPVDEVKLFSVLDRAMKRVDKAAPALLLQANGIKERIPVDSIRYAEAFPHHLTLHMKDKTQDFRIRFGELESLLSAEFIRCHRSYIVNMKYVRRITRKAVILDNGEELPLSRAQYDTVNEGFIRSVVRRPV